MSEVFNIYVEFSNQNNMDSLHWISTSISSLNFCKSSDCFMRSFLIFLAIFFIFFNFSGAYGFFSLSESSLSIESNSEFDGLSLSTGHDSKLSSTNFSWISNLYSEFWMISALFSCWSIVYELFSTKRASSVCNWAFWDSLTSSQTIFSGSGMVTTAYSSYLLI